MIIEEKSKAKYILIAVIVLVLLIIAGFVYQQKMIVNLKNEVGGIDRPTMRNQTGIASASTISAVQNSIADSTKELEGTVTAKNDNLLTIEAVIVDFSKLSGLHDSALKQTDSLPNSKKTFSVKIDANTIFSELKMDDINVGDQVIVFTNNPIYKTDDLTASKVLVTSSSFAKNPSDLNLADYIKQDKAIAGPIKTAGDNYFVIESNWIDYSKIDYSQAKNIGKMDPASVSKITTQYKVFVDDKTVFTNKKFSELKVGDMVAATSDKPTFSVVEFTATKIEGPLQPPSK
ncbi:MAG: hypothetical protein WC643_03545 [Parcubacteria group bacterium]|jgi:hypothetical protein